ncbi:MAG: hypothetical protein HQM15_01035 [Deltaproteobacteria bacterium]|nr:hypothetical protein [Deltaproteobacteria bacterium]
MISLANRDGSQNLYNDLSSGEAIQELKDKHDFSTKMLHPLISGEEMMQTIFKGISDSDNHAASSEYIDLKKFTTDNNYRMTPEARNEFNIYERYVRNAQSQGRTGLNPFEMKGMYMEMKNANVNFTTPASFDSPAFNQIAGSTLPQYNVIGMNTPIVPSNNGYVPSFPGTNFVGQTPSWAPTAGIAANETAKVWGDPHFVDPDGGHFDVQGEAGKTYNMLDDNNLNFNARFDDAGKGTTVIGQTGITLQGWRGTSQIQFSKEGTASINGQILQPGAMETLADGGHALLSEDGKTLTLKTGEGYTITQRLVDGRIDADVKSPAEGIDTDGRMPGGLLGQTFDADNVARNSSGHQGEGAIAGTVGDYEVPGGVFGFANSNNIASYPNLVNPYPPTYSNFPVASAQAPMSIPTYTPAFTASSLASVIPQVMPQAIPQSDQSLDFMLSQTQRGEQQASLNDSNSQTDKILQQLLVALKTGNIDVAMLLFSDLESKQSTQMTGMLTQQLVQLQQSRKQMMMQMNQNQNQTAGQNGVNPQSNTAALQANVQEVNDSIQMLTSFIKDISEQKNRVAEFANNYLSTEHQTSMDIVRGMR